MRYFWLAILLVIATVITGLTAGYFRYGFLIEELLATREKMSAIFGGEVESFPAPAPLINNVYGRNTVSLNGKWNIIPDEHNMGAKGLFGGAYSDLPSVQTGMELVEFSFDSHRQLTVPGDWNSQDPYLFRYRDIVWYQRNIEVKKDDSDRLFVHFDAVNYDATVFLNGQPLATHKGGYTAFNVELTDAIVDGDNHLVVRVDAFLDDSTIPTKRTSDFFKYGGIIRDVHLLHVPQTFIQNYHVYLDDLDNRQFKGWVQLDGPDQAGKEVALSINDGDVVATAVTNKKGHADLSFTADLPLWSPQAPELHDVTLSVGEHKVKEKIGFRTISVEGANILLNGEPVFLRGISMHDESYLKAGMANDRADAEAQLGLIKELNGNFVRLAHYPHNEHTLRVADELGLMVWSEVPIVSIIDWENEETLAVALNQISDNVLRDLNRASIVMWSIANETMPRTDARLEFLESLADRARSLDDSNRPLAAALVGDPTQEFSQVIRRLIAELLRDPEVTDESVRNRLELLAELMIWDDMDTVLKQEIKVLLSDPLGEVVDIIGYNEYFGWYYSAFLHRLLPVDEAKTRDTMLKIMEDIRFNSIFDKPIVISEFGAGAKKGYESEFGPGAIWTEEYQARVYEHQLDMLQRSESVQGLSPWVLKDFRSALRSLNRVQDTYNRKGLVSEKGERKQGFYVLRDFYQKQAAQ